MYVADLVRTRDCYQAKANFTIEVFCLMDLSLWESGVCAYMYHKRFCCIHSPTHQILSTVATIYFPMCPFANVIFPIVNLDSPTVSFPNDQVRLPHVQLSIDLSH